MTRIDLSKRDFVSISDAAPMTTFTTTDARDDLMSLYLRQWKTLRSLLRKRSGSHDLAEEAVQETWLRLADMKSTRGPILDQQAFLLRIAGNIAIDLARKDRRHSARCLSDEAILQAIADNAPSPETITIDCDQLRFLAIGLSKLAPKPRTALLLNRCDGLSHRDIAKRLRVSESMVARYLAQALRYCRDHFRAVA
ncbi:RNA polymerase sigma factor [Labrys sp. ZIDIC5]|nr:RNA polymerase sigma factor [Labrys sp. ZIDIC5]